eukprot:6194346-Pleurochrysis_carterae.AAC.1
MQRFLSWWRGHAGRQHPIERYKKQQPNRNERLRTYRELTKGQLPKEQEAGRNNAFKNTVAGLNKANNAGLKGSAQTKNARAWDEAFCPENGAACTTLRSCVTFGNQTMDLKLEYPNETIARRVVRSIHNHLNPSNPNQKPQNFKGVDVQLKREGRVVRIIFSGVAKSPAVLPAAITSRIMQGTVPSEGKVTMEHVQQWFMAQKYPMPARPTLGNLHELYIQRFLRLNSIKKPDEIAWITLSAKIAEHLNAMQAQTLQMRGLSSRIKRMHITDLCKTALSSLMKSYLQNEKYIGKKEKFDTRVMYDRYIKAHTVSGNVFNDVPYKTNVSPRFMNEISSVTFTMEDLFAGIGN